MSIKGINFKTKIWPCLTVLSSPDLVSVLDVFFITDSHILHQNIVDFKITERFFMTQHLIWCKWCNYCFLNVLHFEHNDILFSDFGSWISLVELNLGTNQLSRLPGMSSVWLYHFNIWEKPLNYSFHLSLQKFGIAVGLPHHTLWWALL